MESFAVTHLSFCYPEAARSALSDLSFQIRQGEFITICGLSGCGKSTLLRQFKTCLTPFGQQSGTILFEGQPLAEVPQSLQAEKIGFVQQSPDNACVTDKVWHELAFGAESLGWSKNTIRQRVAETASFFGMEDLFERSVDTLSGGQKQLLQIASVMVMQPSVLLLDEPTAQLDPIAAHELLGWLRKINTELGVTILMSEHHLEEVCAFSDRLIVLSEGRLLSDTAPQQTSGFLFQQRHAAFLSLPSPTRLFELMPHTAEQEVPLSAAQGRRFLTAYLQEHPPQERKEAPQKAVRATPCWEGKELWFRYEKGTPDILKSCSLTLFQGEFLTIIGGNGAGKTTLLSLIAGVQKSYRGRIRTKLSPGETAFLPQNPQTLFVRSTVREDLTEMLKDSGLSPQEQEERLRETVDLCGLSGLLEQHPYDLSGGEQQKAALAKILLSRPRLLLLDEPTKGLDCAYQYRLAQMLRQLTANGITVVAVSHDMAFCAAYADRCAMLFNGQIVSEGEPKAFFAANHLYTTAIRRMTKDLLPNTITVKDVLSVLHIDNEEPSFTDDTFHNPPPFHQPPSVPSGKHQTTRKHTRKRIVYWCGRFCLLIVFLLSLLCSAGTITLPLLSEVPVVSYAVLTVSAILWLLLSCKGRRALPVVHSPPKHLSGVIAGITVFAVVPLTIILGWWLLDDTKYLFLSLIVMLESTVPFFWLFEKRNISTREFVLIAVLCAVCVGGRSLFYMLPACKPVMALVIMAGVALDGESGFLIGAVSMLVSNFFFGQGLWTPWQMMAMGLVGYIAGRLFHRGFWEPSRASVAVYGFLAAIVLYGGIMNPVTLLLSRTPLTVSALLTVYAAGLPSDIIQAAATALFLYYGAEPMLTKIVRVRKKYGLLR